MELAKYVPEKLKNIMIVTDKPVLEKSGAMEKINSQLNNKDIFLYDEIEENPSVNQINRLAIISRERNIELVLGVGGGSCMDAAKGIALLKNNEGEIEEYLRGKIPCNSPVPNICIPTSSGTGSEATPYAVFTDRKNNTKGAVSNPGLFPTVSIIDPELTWSMPESVIINTGFDALTHCIEAYMSTETFELNDQIALSGIKTVIDNLEKAMKNNKTAMCNMSYASLLGGIVIAHASTILLHIMAYPLTVFNNIPHGRANAILLPGFMNFMREKSYITDKVSTINKLFSESGGITNFTEKFGIPSNLSEMGIEPDQYSLFAKKTIIKGDVKITPAKITEEEIINIYNKLY